ncbi:hypothetical protein DRJ22_03360 [Candidatus Woesearchaeota archaeon]|nr:MAG: hypothetical protein DRJ22_03360 [Candidatus Woesearchaeota archaeon]
MESIIIKTGFLLILSSGLIAGFLIAKTAKQELKKGKKYFKIIQNILIATITGTILWQHSKITAIITAITIFSLQAYLKPKLKPQITIPTLTTIGLLQPITQIQVFLYTIPTASKEYPKKPIKEIILLLITGMITIILQSIF